MNLINSIFEKTYKKNIPLYTVFELTYRCNLNCIHCYIPEKDRNLKELSVCEIKNILRQLKSAGSLFLVFTGGEIFLRDDLFEILRYARNLKFDLRIFTNGTLIDRNIAQFLSKIGISGVEISLYGREKTHDKITQVRGSFQKTYNAVKTLVEYKIPVVIKLPLMKENFHDYRWIISFSKKFGIKYKLDPVIVPKNNGDMSVLKHKLKNAQLRKIFSDRELAVEKPYKFSISQSYYSYSLTQLLTYSLFCSAGRNFVGISPEGIVYPCIQFLYPLGDLKKNSFKKIWFNSKRINYLRKMRPEDCKYCFQCKNNIFCRRCPGLVYLETGSILGKSKISCSVAKVTEITLTKN
ncbi:MAG: radical SAM protein [Endomicrobiia bacterium]